MNTGCVTHLTKTDDIFLISVFSTHHSFLELLFWCLQVHGCTSLIVVIKAMYLNVIILDVA